MLKKQFFGPLTWKILATIALVHVAAFLVRDTSLETIALALAFVATVYLANKRLEYGLVIGFAEIFVGGHGHLLAMDVAGFSVSLRMIIFGAVMLVWLWKFWRSDIQLKRDAWRELPFVILFIAIVSGLLQGIALHGFPAAFDDANGYLLIGYLLPLISIEWTATRKRMLLQTLAASAVWVSAFSLTLLYVFTHIDGDTLNVLYTFVRDSRLAEVTLQVISTDGAAWMAPLIEAGLLTDGDYFYRVFMQSQSTVMMMLLLAWSAMLLLFRDQRLSEVFGFGVIVLFATLFMSLSRSFLLATCIAMGLIWLATMVQFPKRWLTIKRTVMGSLYAIASFVLVWILVVVPVPTRPDLTNAAFFQTSADTGRTEAVVSRWSLLDPLMDSIYESPLIGQGFGAPITYESSDPRIIEETGGQYTTYRFEWGWHDIWLKMGILGLIAFVAYLLIVFYSGYAHVKKHKQHWLIYGLAASIVAMFITHTFSPYLNHPIGLAWMLFLLPFLDTESWGRQMTERMQRCLKFDRQKQAVVVSQLAKRED